MGPVKKSGKSSRRSKGNTARPSEDHAFQEIETLLNSLGEINPTQTGDRHRSNQQQKKRAPRSPGDRDSVEHLRDKQDVDMPWADILCGAAQLQPSPHAPRQTNKKTKTKSKKAPKPRSSPIEKQDDALIQEADNSNNLEMNWADLLRSGTDVEHIAQAPESTKTKKKRSKRGVAEKPACGSIRTAPVHKTNATGKGQKRVSAQGPYGNVDGALDDLPAMASDEAETNEFLEKVRSLAAEKKRVQEARIARANKRTAATMENLASQTEVLNRQVVGKVSKYILTKSSPIDKKAHALQSAAKKQKIEWDHVQAAHVQSLKETLSDMENFMKRVAVLKEKFKSKQEAMAAQEDNAIQKEVRQLRAQVERRNIGDLRLMKLRNFLQQG